MSAEEGASASASAPAAEAPASAGAMGAEEAAARKRYEALVQVRAKAIKGKLEELDRSNATSRKVPGCGPGSSTDRTRTSVVAGLGKKLKDLMDDFQVYMVQFVSSCARTCPVTNELCNYMHAGAEGEDGRGV